MTVLSSIKLWELRWNEVEKLDRDNALIIIPTGAIEQHGHHLPVDTDIKNSTEIALAVAKKAGNGSVIVAPPVWWGTSPHHLAYPGTISLRMETMSALLVDICASLSRHEFYRILILNGHGGNVGVLFATALRISEEIGISPAVVSYWALVQDELKNIGDSAKGGMGHACEMETSLYLYHCSDRVALDQIESNMPKQLTSFSCIDFRDPGPVMIPWDFVRDSKTGTMGDPTKGTAEKGKKIFEAAVDKVLKLSNELLALKKEDFKTGATRDINP